MRSKSKSTEIVLQIQKLVWVDRGIEHDWKKYGFEQKLFLLDVP